MRVEPPFDEVRRVRFRKIARGHSLERRDGRRMGCLITADRLDPEDIGLVLQTAGITALNRLDDCLLYTSDAADE